MAENVFTPDDRRALISVADSLKEDRAKLIAVHDSVVRIEERCVACHGRIDRISTTLHNHTATLYGKAGRLGLIGKISGLTKIVGIGVTIFLLAFGALCAWVASQ